MRMIEWGDRSELPPAFESVPLCHSRLLLLLCLYLEFEWYGPDVREERHRFAAEKATEQAEGSSSTVGREYTVGSISARINGACMAMSAHALPPLRALFPLPLAAFFFFICLRRSRFPAS